MNIQKLEKVSETEFSLWLSTIKSKLFWQDINAPIPKGKSLTKRRFALKRTIRLQNAIMFELLASFTAYLIKENNPKRKLPVRQNLKDNYLVYLIMNKIKEIDEYSIFNCNKYDFGESFCSAIDEYLELKNTENLVYTGIMILTISERLQKSTCIDEKKSNYIATQLYLLIMSYCEMHEELYEYISNN